MSNISSMVSARMTPVDSNSASTTASAGRERGGVAARRADPARVRPAFTATIGLRRPIRRASSPNFRGLPNDSR